MFSMTATAPSSCKHRRLKGANSPRATPTKPLRPQCGQHSPHPPKSAAKRHARRHSDATTVLMGNSLPPAMPLESSEGLGTCRSWGCDKGETKVLVERGREAVVRREIFRDDDNSNHDGDGRVKDCIERMNSLMSEEDADHVHVQSGESAKPNENLDIFRPAAAHFNNHARNTSYDDLDEGDEYFDRCSGRAPVESPTYQSLRHMESSRRDNASKFGYERSASSCSMEPLFDDSAGGNAKSLLALRTVFSADRGDGGEADSPPRAAATNPVRPPEAAPSPSCEEQTSAYDAIGSAYETCSSTDGVFVDDGTDVDVASTVYRRSPSMQPIFGESGFSSADTGFDEEDPPSMVNNKLSTPVEETPPETNGRKVLCPASPIVYRLSSQPASPLLSDIHTEINNETAENDAFGGMCARLTGVSLSHDSGSDDVGGDAYFDRTLNDSEEDVGGDAYFDRDPEEDATKDRGANANSTKAGNSKDDELMQPIALPPRLKRTTNDPEAEDMNVSLEFPLTPGRAGQNGGMALSPRRNFAHTHSLLDDCSDDEDDVTSFQMVDSPTRQRHSYSCFPKREHANNQHSPIVSYLNFKKQKHNRTRSNGSPSAFGGTVDHNIQQAMLKTRHRRWTCQSAAAGSHAQSNQVFDASNRVQYISIRENKMNWKYRRNSDLRFIEDDDPECTDDGPVIVLARMSVPNAAIRAGALACGLWRTVRLVRLPNGLFEKHWLLWKEKKYSFEEVYDENDVWAVLQMLRETFPLLDQIDFGGDIGAATSNENMRDERKEWKKEIVSRILQILPNLIAIDGFDVDKKDVDVGPTNQAHRDFVPMQTEVQVRSGPVDANLEDCPTEDCTAVAAGTICEPVDVQMCGWTHLVEAQAQGIQKKFSFDVAEDLHCESVEIVEAVASFTAPEQCSVAGNISSDAIDHVSENILSMIETCVNPKHERQKSYTVDYPSLETDSQESQEKDTDQLLSSPTSSNSWESTSGNRPPICPGSSSHQRRIPAKPLERKKSKGSMLKASLKRRVLGLIPTVSVMDEEEDSDDNENVECPADLL